MFLIAWMPLPVEIREEKLFLIDDKEKTGSFKNKRGTEPLSGIVASDMHPKYETKMAFDKLTGNGWERKNTVTTTIDSNVHSLDIMDSEPVGSGEVPGRCSPSSRPSPPCRPFASFVHPVRGLSCPSQRAVSRSAD